MKLRQKLSLTMKNEESVSLIYICRCTPRNEQLYAQQRTGCTPRGVQSVFLQTLHNVMYESNMSSRGLFSQKFSGGSARGQALEFSRCGASHRKVRDVPLWIPSYLYFLGSKHLNLNLNSPLSTFSSPHIIFSLLVTVGP